MLILRSVIFNLLFYLNLLGLLVAALLATVLYVGVLLALGVTEVRAILTLVQARLTRQA